MNRSKRNTYLIILLFMTLGLILSWLFPSLFIIDNLRTNDLIDFTEQQVFQSVQGTLGNYLHPNSIMVLYIFAVIFALFFIFFKDKPGFVIRLKSRDDYVNKHLADIILVAFFFSLLIEIVNIAFSFVIFDAEVVLKSKLIFYSVLDFFTEFLFYMRTGLILFIAGIIFNKKIAPFIAFALYFLEYFSTDVFPFLYSVWMPYKDAVAITNLIAGDLSPWGVLPMVLRGIAMNWALIWLARRLFMKKDMIQNEKR